MVPNTEGAEGSNIAGLIHATAAKKKMAETSLVHQTQLQATIREFEKLGFVKAKNIGGFLLR